MTYKHLYIHVDTQKKPNNWVDHHAIFRATDLQVITKSSIIQFFPKIKKNPGTRNISIVCNLIKRTVSYHLI